MAYNRTKQYGKNMGKRKRKKKSRARRRRNMLIGANFILLAALVGALVTAGRLISDRAGTGRPGGEPDVPAWGTITESDDPELQTEEPEDMTESNDSSAKNPSEGSTAEPEEPDGSEKAEEPEKTTESEAETETEKTTEATAQADTEPAEESGAQSGSEGTSVEGETKQQQTESESDPPSEAEEPSGYEQYSNQKYAWWFVRMENHEPSQGGEEFDIGQYGGYYRDKNAQESDRVIYLTFDCGYELGFTDTILDTLKEHDARAIFFVTKSFIKSNPELVIRMKEEGHMVGNHTVTHPSMPDKSIDQLKQEITQCADYMYEQTGYHMDPYLRPPMGEYSERTLKLTQDMGYKSIFWSIAYKDYDAENQPGKQYVIDHFSTYHHNGAIPLIHNTSESNMEALDEVLTMLEEAGYRFGTLDEL